jgi:hypothetical protein
MTVFDAARHVTDEIDQRRHANKGKQYGYAERKMRYERAFICGPNASQYHQCIAERCEKYTESTGCRDRG